MKTSELFKQYLEHLFLGKRCQARELIFSAHDRGVQAAKLLRLIIWPAMDQVAKLYRSNDISLITEHMATRINRMLADQLHGFLPRQPKTGQRMVVSCGTGEGEELGAQIIADLFEARGWAIWFLGSGVPNDEILEFVGKIKPDILCVFGTQPSGVPDTRRLIDLIRGVGVCSEMQILVSGGVFNRAEGLAEEIRADLFAPTVTDALKTVAEHPVRIPKPDVPEPGRRRKRKRASGAVAKAAMRQTKAAVAAS
ncbi:MAG TPA: cobalamin-dependent protein [Phycisphaerae bacterium]|nr:cobalamin-dependent protein [Phycisphaerae bacterium]